MLHLFRMIYEVAVKFAGLYNIWINFMQFSVTSQGILPAGEDACVYTVILVYCLLETNYIYKSFLLLLLNWKLLKRGNYFVETV